MQANRYFLRTLLTALLLVAAAGCSGGDDQTQSAAGQVFEMPSHSDVEARELSRFADAQVLVAECMHNAGHEYVMPDPAQVITITDTGFLAVDAETAAEVGYGISIQFESAPTDAAVEDYIDPNELYLSTLSESEREAWQLTFQGDEGAPGCVIAGDSVFSQLTQQDRVLAKFSDQLQEIYDRAASDQRVVEGNQSWVSCMTAQGYDYAHPEDAVYDVTAQFEVLNASGVSGDDPAALELQEFERSLAVADASCPFNNFGGWEETMEAIYASYEQQFVDQHAQEILAYLAEEEL